MNRRKNFLAVAVAAAILVPASAIADIRDQEPEIFSEAVIDGRSMLYAGTFSDERVYLDAERHAEIWSGYDLRGVAKNHYWPPIVIRGMLRVMEAQGPDYVLRVPSAAIDEGVHDEG